jgi:hypothetical protein
MLSGELERMAIASLANLPDLVVSVVDDGLMTKLVRGDICTTPAAPGTNTPACGCPAPVRCFINTVDCQSWAVYISPPIAVVPDVMIPYSLPSDSASTDVSGDSGSTIAPAINPVEEVPAELLIRMAIDSLDSHSLTDPDPSPFVQHFHQPNVCEDAPNGLDAFHVVNAPAFLTMLTIRSADENVSGDCIVGDGLGT